MVTASTLLCFVSLGWIPTHCLSHEPAQPSAELGELAQFKGFWIVNSDRRSRRAVFQTGPNTIQTTTSEYRENFGCPSTRFRTIRMTYSPTAKTYHAKLKWTGKSIEEHRRAPWLKHQFTGVWNAETNTMI